MNRFDVLVKATVDNKYYLFMMIAMGIGSFTEIRRWLFLINFEKIS